MYDRDKLLEAIASVVGLANSDIAALGMIIEHEKTPAALIPQFASIQSTLSIQNQLIIQLNENLMTAEDMLEDLVKKYHP